MATAATLTSPCNFTALRVPPGEDILTHMQARVCELGARAAFIATCVGSLTRVSIRFANQAEGTLLGPSHYEIVSLVGTLSCDGSAHVHVSVCDATGATLGGHLLPGSRVYTTAEIVLGVLPSLRFDRAPCPVSGYDELLVRGAREEE